MAQELKLPAVGSSPPAFEGVAVDGQVVRLTDYAGPVALVFLRHLA